MPAQLQLRARADRLEALCGLWIEVLERARPAVLFVALQRDVTENATRHDPQMRLLWQLLHAGESPSALLFDRLQRGASPQARRRYSGEIGETMSIAGVALLGLAGASCVGRRDGEATRRPEESKR